MNVNRELHRVVPTVIIYNNEGKFLITKRSENVAVYPGRWDTPGGGLSMDDYEYLPPSTSNDKQWYFVLEEALRREVREEVNLEIGKPEYLLDLAFIRPDGIPVIVLVYLAPYKSGEIKLSSESTEFAWVGYDDAKTRDLIGDILLEIEMAEKRLQERKLLTIPPLLA